MPDEWNSPYYSIDPFPDVAPSLLNSADIVRYAEKGCLIHPYSHDRELLNPATYTIRFLGTLYSWDQTGRTRSPRETPVTGKKLVRLPANSISYLETAEKFRLPQYIAARFNLHIRHVHRGILLGTGPMVDPGFVGSLLIPLHNLTDNDYDVRAGDDLLWVEFTKLTCNAYWHRSSDKLSDDPPDDLVVFRSRKMHLNAHQYFRKAEVSSRGVISAFKGALEASEQAANTAKRTVQWFTTIGAIGLVVGVGTLTYSAFQLFQGNSDMASRIHDRLDRVERATGLLPPLQDSVSETGLPDAANVRSTQRNGDEGGSVPEDAPAEDAGV